MQQQERGGSTGERKQQQDRRLKEMMQGGGGSEQQQQQPQKCPRCESPNTKFCYYNNYSLSQPRYFCKTCRRYWTQGGTLRNVPVGGGCRKGKRNKTYSATGETSRAFQPQPPPPQQKQPQPNLTIPQNILSSNPVITKEAPVLRTKEPAAGNLTAAPSSIGSYYPTSGFLSSLTSIQPQSFNPHPQHQSLNIGGADHHSIEGSSNLGLLQRFSVPSFGSTIHQQIQHPQIYRMGNIEKSVIPMYHHNPSEESSVQSTRHGSSYQGFNNTTNTALWGISSTSSGNTNSNTNTVSVSDSLNPNQWPDLRDYGHPP